MIKYNYFTDEDIAMNLRNAITDQLQGLDDKYEEYEAKKIPQSILCEIARGAINIDIISEGLETYKSRPSLNEDFYSIEERVCLNLDLLHKALRYAGQAGAIWFSGIDKELTEYEDTIIKYVINMIFAREFNAALKAYKAIKENNNTNE